MRQINLLPSDILERRRMRRITSVIVLGITTALALLLIFFLIQAGRLAGVNGKLDDQQRQNKGLENQVAQLARFAQDQQELNNKRLLLTSLTTNEVRWSVVFADVATYVPADVWLTNFTGSVQALSGETTNRTGQVVAQTFGTVQFSGCTLEPEDGTHLEVAKWLVRIGMPKEFLSPYLSVSSKGSAACPVSFSSTVALSDQALRKNQRGGAREP